MNRFSFDPDVHAYFLDGERIPSVTQLLELGGLVNGLEYFTEESRRRGTAVHALCTDYDLGVLDLSVERPFRGYALGYAAMVKALQPRYEQIEELNYHPELKFGGRPDRVGMMADKTGVMRPTVLEIKSGAPARHHGAQTALQAILDGFSSKRAPDAYQRVGVYIRPSGRWSVDTFEDPRDLHKAHDLIRRFCL